jgi:hypothetical protein
MTSTIARTYIVGDTVPEGVRGEDGSFCGANTDAGWICSLPLGHTGPQHLTISQSDRRVLGTADRDESGDPIVEQPTPEVLAERLAYAVHNGDQLRRLLRDMENQRDEALRERDELRDELATARGNLDRQRADADEAMEAFRQRVGEVAMRYARAHDWCSVVQAALGELGIEVKQRYRVTTDVHIHHGDWYAKREGVVLTVESTSTGQAWRDVDNTTEWDDVEALLSQANITLPDEWDFDKFDSSTDVELADD